MPPRYLRLVFVVEFLIAVIAVFTAWSEIGGQAALDLMPWGWKFGLGLSLSLSLVAYSAALLANDAIWNSSTAKWLAFMLVLLLAMGAVTYYYVLKVAINDSSDEQDNAASLHSLLINPNFPER